MKTPEEDFLREWQQKQNLKSGSNVDYRRLIPYTTVLYVMDEYSKAQNDSLIQEIDDQEKLLVCFMSHLRNKGVAFNKDYTQEDLERIAYVYLRCEDPDSDEEYEVYVEPTNRPSGYLSDDDLYSVDDISSLIFSHKQ